MTIRPIPLRIGRNQKSLSYKSDPSERATEIAAKCAQLAGKNTFLGNARFQVSASNSGAKTFVAVDPTGAKGPVGFDSQLVGFSILREKTNTLATITATVTVSQLVTLATWPSGMADGEYVQLRDADGLIPYVLQHPVYAAATYPGIGPKAGTIDRSDVVAVSNLLPNAVMRTWSDHAKMPDGWTVATLGSSPTFASASDTPPSGVTITRTTDPLYTQVGGASLGFSMNQAVFISPPIAWTPQYTGQRFSVLISMLLTTWAAIPSAFLRVQWGVRLSDGTVLPWFDPDLMQQVEPTKTRPAPWKQIAGGVWVELELPGFDITAPSTYPINLRPNASDLAGIATADGYVLILTLSANGGTAVVEGFLDGMIVTASDDVVDALSEFGDANGVYQDVENALGKIAGPQYSFSADVLDLKRLNPDLDEDELDRGNFVAVDSPDLGIVNDVQRITDARINDLVEGDTTITIEPRLKRFTRRLLAGAKKTSDRITATAATTTGTTGTSVTGTTIGGSTSGPGISLDLTITADVPLTVATVSPGVVKVKFIVTTTPYATTADAITAVRLVTASTTTRFSYSGLDGSGSAASPGDTAYAYALAYDNNDIESPLATASADDPAAFTDPGSQVNHALLFGDSMGDAGLLQSGVDSSSFGIIPRWDFVDEDPILQATDGYLGGACMEEPDAGGGFNDMYWQYTTRKSLGSVAYARVLHVTGRLNLNGQTIGYEVPLIQGYPTIAALSLTASRTLRLWMDDYSGTPVLLGESVDVVPSNTQVIIEFHAETSATANAGVMWVRINGVLVEWVPEGGGAHVRFFDNLAYAESGTGYLTESIGFGTGTGFDYPFDPNYASTNAGYAANGGIIGVQWDDLAVWNSTGAATKYDFVGNVTWAPITVTASGISSDDNDTSYDEVNAADPNRSYSLNALPVGATDIVAVAPFYLVNRHAVVGGFPSVLSTFLWTLSSGGSTDTRYVRANPTRYYALMDLATASTFFGGDQTQETAWAFGVDPHTSATWTRTAVNAVTLSVAVSTNDDTKATQRISQMGLDVAYRP